MNPEIFHYDDKTFSKGNPERRSYPRHRVHKVVSYTRGQKKLLTVTVDLALGGMKIKTHYKLPEDGRMNLNIVLRDNSISLDGRVVYSRTLPDKNRVSGIQFLRLSRRDSALLRAYLAGVQE